MKVFTCVSFTGVQPTQTAAVVVADSADQAYVLLNIVLKERGLPGDAKEEDMVEVKTRWPGVQILSDGDY